MASKRKRNSTATNNSHRRSRDGLDELKKFRRNQISAAILLSTTVATAPAVAQDIEEIIVTATRREAAISEIPYNISAVSNRQLAENRITELKDLAQYVAGMSYVNTGPSNRGRNNTITLRGITGDDTSNNGGFPVPTDAPVSVYIGETPLFLPLQMYDIERVEVLRGPQGTLYGSGSLAGTIRFIPEKPDTSAFYAELAGDVGAITSGSDEWNWGGSGIVNIPLNDRTAVRISGGYQHWGGFIDMSSLVQFDDPSTAEQSPIGIPTAADPANINSGFVLLPEKEDANDADIWHVRASLLWNVSDATSVLVSYFHQEDDVSNIQADFRDFQGGVLDHIPAAINPFSPNTAGPIDYPTGGTVFPASNEYDLPKLLEESSGRTTDLFSLDLEFDLGFASITSSTSYYEDHQTPVIDVSAAISQAFGAYYGFMPRLVDIDYTDNNLEGFAQEIRLVSTTDSSLEYVVGAFFQNVKRNDSTIQYIPGQTFYDSIAFGFHANPQIGDVNFITRYDSDFDDLAFFGELTWHVNDNWQITGGIRAFSQDFAVDTFSQLPYCGIFCGDNPAGDTVVAADQSVDDQIFKLNTSYNINDDQMVYFTYAEGFRRGGANGIPLAGPFAASPSLLLYEPDLSENYELGLKGSFGTHNYTVALYHIDWKNLQVNDGAAAGGYDLVANGTKAISRGVELELSGRFGDQFRYGFAYSYIDAEIDDSFEVLDNFFGMTVPIISTSKGDPLPNTSEHSVSLSMDYTQARPIWNDWNVRWHLNGSYRSDVQSGLVSLIPGDPQPFVIDSFSLWDASVNVQNAGNTSVSLYIDNLTDERAVTGGIDSQFTGPRGKFFFVGRPRTVGLRVNYTFGGQ
jgi:outer membrane receptor protein involved in Fe transport